MSQEMPGWFKEICAKAYDENLYLADVFAQMFAEFSKPENLLKIDVVKNVVENSIKVIDANSENFDACFLNDLYNSIEQFKE